MYNLASLSKQWEGEAWGSFYGDISCLSIDSQRADVLVQVLVIV